MSATETRRMRAAAARTEELNLELSRLGAAIRDERRRRKLTQAIAAKRADVHRNYWSAIERGEVNPSYGLLLRIGGGLGVPPERLIAKARAKHNGPASAASPDATGR